MNAVLDRMAKASQEANINLSYAFKFFDPQGLGKIAVRDLDQLFAWMKCEMTEPEKRALVKALHPDEQMCISSAELQQQIYVASQKMASVFDETNWVLAARDMPVRILDKAN